LPRRPGRRGAFGATLTLFILAGAAAAIAQDKPVPGPGVPPPATPSSGNAVSITPGAGTSGNSQYGSGESFAAYARQLRANALMRIEPTVMVPTDTSRLTSRYKWKRNIITTTFWVGETPTQNNPTTNVKSSWDPDWKNSYGGYDDPDVANRRGYIPKKFVPKQNPFYYALPYNDVSMGRTKPEAPKVIPWFRREFKQRGKTVVKGRWLAIRHGNRIAYAQWEDVGPFRTDHWQYVFGNERPTPNLNKGAGLDVSPAVRDYLKMKPTDVCDWRFVEVTEVPPGPWRLYGNNNPFAKRRSATQQVAVNDATTSSAIPPAAKPDPAAAAVKKTAPEPKKKIVQASE
jgi:hypothetical protein